MAFLGFGFGLNCGRASGGAGLFTFFETVPSPWVKLTATRYEIPGSPAAANMLTASGTFTDGETYEIEWRLSGVASGLVRSYFGTGDGVGAWRGADGTYTETLTATGRDYFSVQANASFVGEIEILSVTVAPGGGVLLETGDALLLETGDTLLQEAA